MSTNIWQGAKVRLRAAEPADWEALHNEFVLGLLAEEFTVP